MRLCPRSMLLLALVLLTGLCLLSGCLEAVYPKKKVAVIRPERPERVRPPEKKPPPKPKPPALPQERELLRQAEQAETKSRYLEALSQYEAFLRLYPDSSLADQALFFVGRLRTRLDQEDKAAAAFEKLLQEHPASPFAVEARHRLADLYLKTGRYDRSIELVNQLLAQTDKPEEKARLQILLGQAYAGQEDYPRALQVFLKAADLTSDPVDRFEARFQARATLLKMSPEELAQAKAKSGPGFPADQILYLLAYRLFEAGQTQQARVELDSFLETYPDHELTDSARALSRAIEGQGPPPPLDLPVPPPTTARLPRPEAAPPPVRPGLPEAYLARDVACLLPLSGRAAEYGHLVLKGLRLAFRLYEPQTQDFRARLIVHDSGDDPARSLELLEQLAQQTNILAVVGPVTSSVAAQAAPKAEELSLPLIAVTQQEGIPQAGPYVFRLFLTPKAQAEAVARYAVQILGLTRLAILHPQDEYGRKMRDYFWDEVNRLGAEVVGIEAYDPAATDFSKQIETLSGLGKARRRVRAGRRVEVDFQAVFLPDSYRAVAMIAPQFAYHDITTIRLLGTSLWHTPRLLDSAARYTQRSIIPTAFFAGSTRPLVQQFVQAYRQENQDQDPGYFEAYGFDAGLLLLSLMDQHQVSTRADLIQALSNLGGFSGVTGRFAFTPEGEFRTEPALLTVDGEEFRLVQ